MIAVSGFGPVASESAFEEARTSMRRTMLLFGLVLMLGPGGGAAAQSSAEGTSPRTQPTEVESVDDHEHSGPSVDVVSSERAYETDAATIASEGGISVNAALVQIRFQDAVDLFVGSLPSELLNEAYAGGQMLDGTSPGAILRFKGDVPQAVIRALHESGLEGVVLEGGYAFSHFELQRYTQEAHKALVALGFTSVVSRFDTATQIVELEAVQRPELRALTGMRLAEAVRQSQPVTDILGPNTPPPDLVIREHAADSAPLVQPEHTYGGAGMRDDGLFECTSGFTVVNSAGTEGVLTASHCEGINKVDWNDTSGGIVDTYSAPFVDETLPEGTWGDIEWHTTGHHEYGEFWATHSQKRGVFGRIANVNIDVNDNVCRYGRESQNQDCGTVTNTSINTSFTWNGQAVTTLDLVEVKDILTQGGDSGGPYYLSQTAWGIHQGTLLTGRRAFSKVQNAEFAFSVTIHLAG